jgi:hypothetical protein
MTTAVGQHRLAGTVEHRIWDGLRWWVIDPALSVFTWPVEAAHARHMAQSRTGPTTVTAGHDVIPPDDEPRPGCPDSGERPGRDVL